MTGISSACKQFITEQSSAAVLLFSVRELRTSFPSVSGLAQSRWELPLDCLGLPRDPKTWICPMELPAISCVAVNIVCWVMLKFWDWYTCNTIFSKAVCIYIYIYLILKWIIKKVYKNLLAWNETFLLEYPFFFFQLYCDLNRVSSCCLSFC